MKYRSTRLLAAAANSIAAIFLSIGLLFPWFCCHAQIVEKPVVGKPIKLEAMIPQLDNSKPEKATVLTGNISDTYNPDILEIPISGSNKAYEVGLKLYNEGDYKRAMNAFTLAMIRAAKYGLSDPRVKNAKAAIKSTEAHMNLQAELGYTTDNKDSKALTGKVKKVFQPSLAWLAGLQADDNIIRAKEESNLVRLTVSRHSKTYQINLKLKPQKTINLAAMQGMKDRQKKRTGTAVLTSGLIVHPELLEKSERLLGNYDCTLLIDNSGSMGSIAHAEDRNTLLDSKWEWCRQSSLSFFRDAGKYFPHGLTLVPFNHSFAVAKGAGRAEIEEIFNKLKPSGGTNIAGPLSYVLDDYFERRSKNPKIKPLAIAVMTDGQDSFDAIRNVVVDATVKMRHPAEIKITFLAIGDSSYGSTTLKALDDDLVDAGATYDIVDTRYFEEILKYGLKKVIVAALVEHKIEAK